MTTTPPIRSLTALVDDISKKLCPKINKDKVRNAILGEIHDKIDVIINCIEKFIASNPTSKYDVYKFVTKEYDVHCRYTYLQWWKDEFQFENEIMAVIQEEMGLSDDKFENWYLYNIAALHNLIWSDFVSPLREHLWMNPTILKKTSTGAIAPIQEQITVLCDIKTELSQLLSNIEQS